MSLLELGLFLAMFCAVIGILVHQKMTEVVRIEVSGRKLLGSFDDVNVLVAHAPNGSKYLVFAYEEGEGNADVEMLLTARQSAQLAKLVRAGCLP